MRSLALLLGSLALVACGDPAFDAPSNPLPTSASGNGGSANVGGAGGSGGGDVSTGSGGDPSSSSSSTTASTSNSSSSSSGSGGVGVPGVGSCDDGSPIGDSVIEKQGSSKNLILRGMVVTPDAAFQGEVLVVGDTIACAAVSCSSAAGADTASIVDTKGVILPGLIDTHNHILFDIFDETHWSPTQSYQNHNQWTNEARYKAVVDTKQFLNNETDKTLLPAHAFTCELNKYGELKGLIAGTTSIAGAGTPPSNKACYGTLSRTIDQSPNGGLGPDKIQMATLFPSATSANGVCKNFASGKTDAYVIHIGEGIDATALNEFTKLSTITAGQSEGEGCLYHPKTAIVHGTAFGPTELDVMAAHQMNLVWSPKSNVFLYGAGTDMSKTTRIDLALARGLNVSIAPDWSLGGSQNLLDEVRYADKVDNAEWGDILTPKMLLEMVTINPAKALGLQDVIGSITVGKKADLFVIDGDPTKPYEALLAATPASVRLVLVGGMPLYGDAVLRPIAQAAPDCESMAICDNCKFLCVAQPSLKSDDQFDQTYAEIEKNLNDGLAEYDKLDRTEWDFWPITPLVKCF